MPGLTTSESSCHAVEEFEVAVIGAGFAGLCAAVELLRRGRDSFVVLERADQVGGTWRDNTYPGVACDVPSHLYSFSFAPNPRWSSVYSGGPEILAYLNEVADRFAVRDRIRCRTNVLGATWDGAAWVLDIENRDSLRVRYLIGAVGALNVPKQPELPGLASFEGALFHTAAWRHDLDLAGLKVGIVGTGATAVQVAPEVAKVAAELHVFQRSPVWALPKPNRAYTSDEQEAFADHPELMRKLRWELWEKLETRGVELLHAGTQANTKAQRLALANIVDSVTDPRVAERLIPAYNVQCKRPTLSNDYYRMFNHPNVDLVTDSIERVDARGISAGGRHIDLDVVVLATGFTPFNITRQLDVTGLDDLKLADAWTERIVSYRSVMVTGFPNFFILLGPNSGGLTSAVQMIEASAHFALDLMNLVEAKAAVGLHPIPERMDEFTRRVDALGAGSTISDGCSSWWTDLGVNHALWPGSSVSYRMLLGHICQDHFSFLEAA
jgi:cation diffusion facilitator CzcD-associated flavoprotein CzcO